LKSLKIIAVDGLAVEEIAPYRRRRRRRRRRKRRKEEERNVVFS
jgi:hypothetical protein